MVSWNSNEITGVKVFCEFGECSSLSGSMHHFTHYASVSLQKKWENDPGLQLTSEEGSMERTGSMRVLRAVNAPTLVNHCEAGFLDCIAPHGKLALAGTPQKLSTLDLKKSSSRPRPESML